MGKIEAVTDQPIDGVQVVDVSGLVVAPGFIDLHDETRRNSYLVPARDDLASFSSMTEWNDYGGPAAEVWHRSYEI